MSNIQFAETITSLNVGSGVPCTIRFQEGKGRIEGKPIENKRAIHQENFAKRMEKIEERMDKLTEFTTETLSSKKSIKVVDKEKILTEIRMLKQEVRANIPFFLEKFNEEMNKTVLEAKNVVESFVVHKVQTLGLKELEKIKLLEDK